MNKNLTGSIEPQTTLSYEGLTNMQKQKYNYLKGLIADEEAVLKLVTLVEGRGKNSFSSIVAKIAVLKDAPQLDQEYHDALYENFNIDTVCTADNIISTISQVRNEIGLTPYVSGWKQNCLADFYKLFVVHEVYSEPKDGEPKRQFLGYKPVFKLKSED